MSKRSESDSADPGELRRMAERQLIACGPKGHAGSGDKQLVHELQVHQIELELQNVELQRTRTEAEDALSRYTDLYEFAPVGYLKLGRDGAIRQVNLTAARLLGLARSRLIGKSFRPMVAMDHHPVFDAFLARGFESRVKADCEIVLRPDGARAPVLTVELTGTASGDGEELRVVATDITERKQAEEQRMKYQALFESSTDAVMLLDEKAYFDCNPTAVRMFGAKGKAEICQLHPSRLSPPTQPDGSDSRSLVNLKIEAALKSGRCQFDWTHQRLDTKETFSAEVRLLSLVFAGRQVLQATVRDTTEYLRLQATLAQADRLASMGMLAAGVAHEINNPLTYLVSNVESLVEDLPKLLGDTRNPPALVQDLVARASEALDGALRIRAIAKGLGTFSRVEANDRSAVDVARTIDLAINMAFNEIKFRAQVVRDFGQVPMVWASEGKLAQVFLNLIINATHAIDEGDSEHNRITVRTWADQVNVFAEVADTGKGIPAENLERIFEPFFTTKRAPNGAGLGLAICRKLITDFGGDIHVESLGGRGTRFVVRLPLPSVEAAPPVGALASQPPPNFQEAHGRVLVVDDEPAIRSLLARLLGREHQVVTAATGAEAQAMLDNEPTFDVILCDLMMPQMTGMDLHAWLFERDPALARNVVFMTGGAFTPRASEYLAGVGNLRVEKPFDAKKLRGLVSELVRSAKDPAVDPKRPG